MNPNAAVGDGSVGQFTGFQKSLVHLTDGFVVAEDIGIVSATQNPSFSFMPEINSYGNISLTPMPVS